MLPPLPILPVLRVLLRASPAHGGACAAHTRSPRSTGSSQKPSHAKLLNPKSQILNGFAQRAKHSPQPLVGTFAFEQRQAAIHQ